MTKIILASLFFLAPLAAFSQPVIYFDHSNGGGNSSIQCTSNAPNVWGATSGLGDGLASISYSTVSNCWVVSGLSSGGEWTQISPRYPTTGALAQLYNASGPITGYFGTYYLHFSGFVAPVIPPPSLTAWTTTTTNFWTTPGDVVYFSGSGRNKSASPNTNQLTLSIDGNPIFTGPFTSGCGFAWTLSGTVQWDGTNWLSSGRCRTGDSNNPDAYDAELVTNVTVGVNTWLWSVNGDTNGLTFDSANVSANRAPATGGDSPQHSFVNGNNSAVTVVATNQVLSSQQFVLFSTNYITWGTSNFIGTFPQLQSANFNGGQLGGGGMNLPTNVLENLMISNGPSGWAIWGGGGYTNTVSVAIVGAGGGLGSLIIYGVDHPELVGVTNGFFGQTIQFGTPINPTDAATKSYVDLGIANASFGQFAAVTDTNGGYHYFYQRNGSSVVSMDSTIQTIQINSAGLDGTKTNVALKINQSALAAGWGIQTSTNLLLLNGWQTTSNYSAVTNAGIVTFMIPINPSMPMLFFRAISGLANTFVVTPPITASGGMYYPSNTWNLFAITNTMPNFGIWTGNSNGCCQVTLSLSNGVVRILQSLR